jgi:hypothetical protein
LAPHNNINHRDLQNTALPYGGGLRVASLHNHLRPGARALRRGEPIAPKTVSMQLKKCTPNKNFQGQNPGLEYIIQPIEK